jgi:uncharacterized surface protein with fasciclin (FAS1) repeats
MRITTAKTLAASTCAIALLGVVGCSSDDSSDNAGDKGMVSQETDTSSADSPSEDPSDSPDMAAQLVGPGCADYAKAVPNGAGSVSGMAEDPVAVAASNNPLLTTLVAAVSGKVNPKVDLVDTLNGGEFTVFAPVDDAFAQIPPATLNSLKKPAAAGTLTKILTYHVLAGQIAPDAIAGMHKTVEGEDLEVTGSGDNLQVNGANVICGGVTTANATVYLIDAVMTPPSMG